MNTDQATYYLKLHLAKKYGCSYRFLESPTSYSFTRADALKILSVDRDWLEAFLEHLYEEGHFYRDDGNTVYVKSSFFWDADLDYFRASQ